MLLSNTTQPSIRSLRKVLLTINSISSYSPHSIFNQRCIGTFTNSRPIPERFNIERWDAVVVGGGPAGLAAVGNLLDQGKSKILWAGNTFTGGRLDEKYREVPSNTKVKRFLMYAEGTESFKRAISKSRLPNAYTALQELDQEQTCDLGKAADLCALLSRGLPKDQVLRYSGAVLRATLMPAGGWKVEMDNRDTPFQADMVVLCTGSAPVESPLLSYQTSRHIVKLDLALKPSAFNFRRRRDPQAHHDTVGVVGSSHSAILVLRNLYNMASSVRPSLRVSWFTRGPLRYAVEKDGWILRDNTGLKGEAATWAAENLEDDKLATSDVGRYITKISTVHPDGGEDLKIYRKHLDTCQSVIHAVGFGRNPIPQIFKDGKEIKVDFDHETGTFNDATTGDSIEWLYGAGIAFPERVVDPEGNVEYAVGMWKFMTFLKRVMPTWQGARPVIEEPRGNTEEEVKDF